MATQPSPITVCLIAGNEAARIGRALASVAGWASEIVVVLNEDVSDGTDRIAESHGAKVYREPWKGHIAQKNSAAEKATQPWLLGLDADEEVTAELRDEIGALFGYESEDHITAYSMPRCSYYCGRWMRHGDWYPDRKVRLWRRGKGQWAGKNPHDKLVVSGSVGRLRGDLLHHSMTDLDHHVRKASQYSALFADQSNPEAPKVGVISLWFRPMWRFLRCFFIRLGFLDGWQGYLVAYMVAFETFLRYAKVRELQERESKNRISGKS
ncbi:MAG: glycosyltransferase family 2 protein [Verrucomicrobia bacterium]|nr:glycosyltransferase family 2 protein [Verrucomicrobiota bacterium]